VEEWAEIRRLHRSEGLAIKTIARRLGVSRNTVRAAVTSDAPPKYEHRPAGAAVDAFEPAIRELLAVSMDSVDRGGCRRWRTGSEEGLTP
jgi:transposase